MLTTTAPEDVQHGGMRVLRWRGAGLPGSPIVLLHGLGDGADIWSPVLDALPCGPMAAIAPDLPGHGGSLRLNPRDYTLSEVTRSVAGVLEREMVRSPVLIGHSLGGRIALNLAATGMVAPERVILVDCNPIPGDGDGLTGAVTEHIDALTAGAPTMEGFIEVLKARLPLADPQTLARSIPALVAASTEEGAAAGPAARLALDPEIKRLLAAPYQADGMAQLAALRCPVMIIHGAYSSVLDAAEAADMASRTRKPGRCLSVPKAGHAIALEQPAALAEALFTAMAA